jgi:hypothetical protein
MLVVPAALAAAPAASARVVRAEGILPPGQSGFVSLAPSLVLATWFQTMPAGSLRGLVLVCDDLQREHARLVAAGVGFDQPPSERPWGHEAVLRDSEGNRLVLQAREDRP